MGKITEQQILSMAPNSTAVANARKISSKGGFVSLAKTEDETFYMGECKGSGKSNYTVSVDFIEPENPVCRCSCPSRQYPCKHTLALLYEMMSGKPFAIRAIPIFTRSCSRRLISAGLPAPSMTTTSLSAARLS